MTSQPPTTAIADLDRVDKRWRAVLVGLVASALALSGTGPALPAQAAVSADAAVVINEVYGGGGNSGAPIQRDFVELLNTGDVPVDMSAWSVQYASRSGTAWSVTPLSGIEIAAGGSILVGQARGSNTTLPDIDADVDGSVMMSATDGKVALVSDAAALTAGSGVAVLPQVVDFVGFGNATDFAGSAAPAPSNTLSISRVAGANTTVNAVDFVTGPPTPSGGGGAVDEPDPEPSETSPDPEPTESGPGVTAIADIQGAGAMSPLAGQTVTTEGVVTARYPTGGLNGYTIQTAGTGGAIDFSTHTASDALFVYAPGAVTEVALGDTVRVTGPVSEYRATSSDVHTLTQIRVAPGVVQILPDAATPTATEISWPDTDAEREALEQMLVLPQGEFTVSNTYSTNQFGEVGLAAGDTPLRQPTDVAPPGTPESAEVAADNAARGVFLDDGASTNFSSVANSGLIPPYVSLTEPVVVGGSATIEQPVVIGYSFGQWRFQRTAQVVGDGTGTGDGVTFGGGRDTQAPGDLGGDLSVASFNVLNYFTTLGTDTESCTTYTPVPNGQSNTVSGGCQQRGAWDAEDLERQQVKIVAAIEGLDASVVGLMEIENSAALGEQADEATASLVEALNAAAGTDKWAFVPSSTDLPPASEQDVITNAIIYQPAVVERVGDSRALGDQSADDQAFGNAREPVGQVFAPVDGGDPFLFVVNHFKSKGSAGPWPGDADAGDGQGASNESRERQATALRDWVESIQGETQSVVLAGDFNSYGQEDPLQVLYAAGYVDSETEFDVEGSSYSFAGLSGSLDHVLLNEAAAARATGADIWSINSGESIALEYSRYGYHGVPFFAADPYRSSDHDPVKVGLAAEAGPVNVTLLGINDFHGRINSNTVPFAGTVEELRAQAEGPTVFLSAGDNIGASLFASSVQQDQPTIDVLNALELQASAVGNHEFDQGFADLTDRVEPAAAFSYLGANVYSAGTDTPALQEYELLEADGLTVGVVGVVTKETESLVSPGGITTLDFGEPVEAVNRVTAALSDGDEANGEADVIVALYHEGAGSVTAASTLEELVADDAVFASIVNDTSAEVDAIYTGHTHQTYAWSAPVPGTDRTRPVVQTGSYGANVGRVTLSVDAETGDLLAHTQENVPVTATPPAELIADYPRVAEVNAIVTDALGYAAEIGNQPIAEVSGDITTAFTGGGFVDGIWTGTTRDNRAAESSLGNLVAESIRDSLDDLGAEIGVTNPGGLRAELYDTQAEFGDTAVPGLEDGQISYSQALAVLPFNNTMGLVTMTGSQFDTLLEQQWQLNADGTVPSRAYLQLGLSDNVTYTYDQSRAQGDRVTSIAVDGVPIDPAADYRIGTLSFLAQGGDNFRAFTEGSDYVDTGLLDYEAWVSYLDEQSPVSPSFAKHAVQVQGETTAAAGTAVELAVSNLNMTSLGTPETTEVSVALDGEALGTVPVVAGAATIAATIPADAAAGAVLELILTAEVGTTVTFPLIVAASTPAPGTTPPAPQNPGGTPPGPGVQTGDAWAVVTLSNGGRVEQGGILTVMVTGLTPGQQVAATVFSDPIVASGIPAADGSGSTTFSVAIPSDFALGAHRLVLTSVGESPIEVGLTVLEPGALAVTGAELPLGFALAGALLLVVAGLVLGTRRRRIIVS